MAAGASMAGAGSPTAGMVESVAMGRSNLSGTDTRVCTCGFPSAARFIGRAGTYIAQARRFATGQHDRTATVPDTLEPCATVGVPFRTRFLGASCPRFLEAWRAGLFRRDSLCATSPPAWSSASSRCRWRWRSPSPPEPSPSRDSTRRSSPVCSSRCSAGLAFRSRDRPGAFAVLLFGVTAKYGFAGPAGRHAARRRDARAARAVQARRRDPLHPRVGRARLHRRHRRRDLRRAVGELLRAARR